MEIFFKIKAVKDCPGVVSGVRNFKRRPNESLVTCGSDAVQLLSLIIGVEISI